METNGNIDSGKRSKESVRPEGPFKSLEEVLGLLENVPNNVMYCDRTLHIRYLNRHSLQTLKTIEKLLPISADQVLGSNIDIFHKNPAHQRKLLGDDRNLPMKSQIALGNEKLELNVSAIYGKGREYIGAMVTWSVITEKLRLEEEIQTLKLLMAALSKAQATIEFTLDGNVVTANDSFLKLLGYTLEEAKRKASLYFL